MNIVSASTNVTTGLGSTLANIIVYTANIPPIPHYENLTRIAPLQPGDIKHINDKTGNHWRKVFNVYAKLIYEISPRQHSNWQTLRDLDLLQAHSKEQLLFSSPEFNNINPHSKDIHLIMGKTYAQLLGVNEKCFWVNEYFAINKSKRLIIVPYFDYRQLSNIKIAQLVKIIKSL